MQYTGRDQTPRMGDPAGAGNREPRTFSRRIDCAEGGPRPPVNPATDRRSAREAPPRRAGRRLDID